MSDPVSPPCDQNRIILGGQNGVIQPLLTDLYQITMTYAYWKTKKKDEFAVFDLFFRKNPFHGAFTIFAGLEECLKFLLNFRFSESDIKYLQQVLPSHVEKEFYDYLKELRTDNVRVYALDEGSVVFPRLPLLVLEGPLPAVQLLETTLLNLINYASLVATNAARFRLAASTNAQLLEFGLRRAQGPDGALSASRYTYMGGFDGTSNVLAGKLFGISVRGTHAHSFVSSFVSLDALNYTMLKNSFTGNDVDFLEICVRWRNELSVLLKISAEEANDGELAAFISYAVSFPTSFLALTDTYDCLKSGLLNFCAVAISLNELGYVAKGIRIDSGDLAYLSIQSREKFKIVSEKYNIPWFAQLQICASNDINEETIISLNEQGHQIDCFGIGTHLVTCQRQPALGCVFKLVEVNEQPRIKLSQDVEKVTLPGRKRAFRLYGCDGKALIDLLQKENEPEPQMHKKVLCRHPFEESKRAYVSPAKVKPLYKVYFDSGRICLPLPTLEETKAFVQEELSTLRPDHKRYLNPTPYKVSVTDDLYHFLHDLWLENAPIGELS